MAADEGFSDIRPVSVHEEFSIEALRVMPTESASDTIEMGWAFADNSGTVWNHVDTSYTFRYVASQMYAFEAVSLTNGQQAQLSIRGASPLYVESVSGEGYLVYRQGTALVATSFDVGTLEASGAPVSVLDPVGAAGSEVSLMGYSTSGLLAYATPW